MKHWPEVVRAEVKDWFCSDIDNVWDWIPDREASVCYALDVHVGTQDSEAADLFTIIVCNQQGVATAKEWLRRGRGLRQMMVVEPYDFATVESRIRGIVEECQGPSWVSIQDQLRTHFRWEYEQS